MKKIMTIIYASMLFFSIISFGNVDLYVRENNEKEHVSPNEGEYFAVSDSGDLGDSWPMFRHDPQHTGYSTSNAPETNNVLWSFSADQSLGYVYSSPAVIDNKVYIGANDRNVYCLDALNGSKIWEYHTGGNVQSSPAVFEGKIYVGSSDHNLYCLNALNGNKIWEYQTEGSIGYSPAIYGGKIYIGSSDNNIYCLNADNGSKIWNFTTGNFVSNSPAVSEGKVYIGSGDKKLYCLNALNGSKIWEFLTEDPSLKSSPAVRYGHVYFGGLYKVHCLSIDNGSEIWNASVYSSSVDSSPAVVDGKVYIGGGRKLICFNASNGSELWAYTTEGLIDTSSPAIADGKIFLGSGDNSIYCFNAENGSKIWEYATEYMVRSSPAVADGYVYIGSLDKKVYCFGEINETNQPPSKPTQPVGPTEGLVDTEYTFATTTTDPEGEQIYYWFDWGDGNNSGWIDTSIASHSWTAEADYEIKVKAKDVHDAQSDWSDPLAINIVENITGGPDEEEYGWIFGTISGIALLEGATVCAISDGASRNCKITGENGGYYTSISPGIYTIEASKEGYETNTKYNLEVKNREALEVSFILQEIPDYEPISQDVNEQLIEARIATEIINNKVGGEIEITDGYNVITYNDELNLEIEQKTQPEEIITFRVEADNGTPGQVIVVRIQDHLLDEISVKLDGAEISETTDLDSFFKLENQNTEYIKVFTTVSSYVFVHISIFSERTITITSIMEAISGPTAILIYIVIAMIATIVFLGRFYLRPVYLTYFRKRRQ